MPRLKHSTHSHTSSRSHNRTHSHTNNSRNHEIVEGFAFNQSLPNPNPAGPIPPSISLGPNITTLASLNIRTDDDVVVLLNATVGWVADNTGSTVKFSIYRDPADPNNPAATGTLILSAFEDAGPGSFRISSFSWVDTTILTSGQHLYYLTAQVTDSTNPGGTVIGPIVLTATEFNK